MHIAQLDPLLANQIAAGEVVERPASIVKELLENCFDAHATDISIDIEQGGLTLIRVRDNAQGIHPEDLSLALSRHATSKISKALDLTAIQTLGFRGEALASMASVSLLTLASRYHKHDQAFCVVAEGQAHLEEPSPCAHPVGTTVTVADLFFNTPARRHFLKSVKTEFNHIETVCHRLALSHFEVGFRLTHNQKVIFEDRAATTTDDCLHRLSQVLGTPFVEHALAITFEASGMVLEGWIAEPTFSRSQSDMQYFYVNGRYVRDKVLMHAVRHAFKDVLFSQRQPAYVLYLTVPPASVDVNVHPNKMELRFKDAQRVHQFVARGLGDALEQIRPGVPLAVTPEPVLPAVAQPIESSPTHKPDEPRGGLAASYSFQKPLSLSLETACQVPKATVHEPVAAAFEVGERQPEAVKESSEQAIPEQAIPEQAIPEQAIPERTNSESSAPESTEEMVVPPLGFALAQLHLTFILAQNEQGLVVVDMHAAHERVLYERMKLQYKDQAVASQSLLVPLTLPLSPQEMRTWEQASTLWQQLGLITEALGPTTLVVRATPVLMKASHIPQLIHDTLADLTDVPMSDRLEQAIATTMGNMACRAAIRTNERMTLAQMNHLLREMETTPNSGCCNHGRPTWYQYDHKALDKLFLRGQ